MNRETWLQKAAAALRDLFPEEYEIPEFQISVGLPQGGYHNSTIGECYSSDTSMSGVCSIFISPRYDDPIKVLQTLLHEMIHVENDCQDGHNKRFAGIAKAVGLAGKPTSTYATPALRVKLEKIAKKIGPYPHSAMSFKFEKVQKTYLRKLVCECGYIVRTTQVHIDKGLPTCPAGHEMMEEI